MKSKAIILLIFLPAITVSFVAQKSSARQSAKIKDTTGIAPSVSVRERFRLFCFRRFADVFGQRKGRTWSRELFNYMEEGGICAEAKPVRPSQ
jgi:hypothetical protein